MVIPVPGHTRHTYNCHTIHDDDSDPWDSEDSDEDDDPSPQPPGNRSKATKSKARPAKPKFKPTKPKTKPKRKRPETKIRPLGNLRKEPRPQMSNHLFRLPVMKTTLTQMSQTRIQYIQYEDDLVIFDDSKHWSCLTDDQKYMSSTGSFTVVRDNHGAPVDVFSVFTPQSVLKEILPDDINRKGRYSLPKSDIEEMMNISDDDMAMISFCFRAQKLTTGPPSIAKTLAKKRKEASETDKRNYAKQFEKAKWDECKSWVEHDVYDMVDIRKLSKHERRNLVSGRWVLTVKRDRDGNFLKCKARWVLRGFQDKQKDEQQKDSPAASRPGFRMACQAAANNRWDIIHIDLKTAFLQGESYDSSRNIICELPKELGQPWYMVAKMKKPAYGLNDAPRRWFNVVDSHLRSAGCVPTRGDRCTYVLYSQKAKLPSKAQPNKHQDSGVFDNSALEKLLDPFAGNNSGGRKPCGIVSLHVDDLFMVGDLEFEQTVIAHLKSQFEIGSEDRNDVTFVGQRIQWKGNPKSPGSFIKVDQKLAIDELREVQHEKSLADNLSCNPRLHTEYRSVLGQMNWLQSRTQYHSCYKFSRCASQQAAPTIGDCRSLNKLVRMIKSQPVFLAFHPLKSPTRIIGFPDASYKNNEDKSSQRALTIFLAENRSWDEGQTSARGSLIDYESHKITATTMSTTVAELYSLMKCFGTCLYLKGL